MTRLRILVLVGLIVLVALRPWTWAARGASGLVVPLTVLAIVALVFYAVAVRLGDLPPPLRRAARPRLRAVARARRPPPARTAGDVTRAAEEILRASQRDRR